MKYLIVVLFLVFPLSLLSQNNGESFHLNSMAISPGIYFDNSTSGLVINGELSFAYKSNLFTFSATTGSEVNFFDNHDNFYSLNLLYGREFSMGRKFIIDAHAGIGYFSFKSTRYHWEGDESILIDSPRNTIGLPVSARVRYKFNDLISLGLKFEENFNSVNSVFNTGIIVQWNFKKRK
ncbi:hypothetical protein FF125_06505 [Aureibaculum algae]|uniref:Outer membrane protein beta-barrel domain-containing protein n=1 Tax=Aureibaculum algae TaxID=2584122 RepID=A0A5B7TNC4_9FLAO|nr:hypothetical protein [Aureibaculum algae]QCX38095.1 hypothetical protein FF125_06505 [Aureibaculum algae]